MSSDLPGPIAELLASSFPISSADASFELSSPRLSTGRIRVTARLIILSGGQILDFKEQEGIDLGPADVDQLAKRVATITRRLESCVLERTMPNELARESTPFQAVGAIPESHPLRLQLVRERVREQAESRGFDERFAVLDDWTVVPRTVYFLDLASNIIPRDGLEFFIADSDPIDVIGVLEAFEAVDCDGLARHYRQALGLVAKEQVAAILQFIDLDWLDQAKAEPTSQSWSEIDSHQPNGTQWRLKHELEPALVNYIERHWLELTDPDLEVAPNAGST